MYNFFFHKWNLHFQWETPREFHQTRETEWHLKAEFKSSKKRGKSEVGKSQLKYIVRLVKKDSANKSLGKQKKTIGVQVEYFLAMPMASVNQCKSSWMLPLRKLCAALFWVPVFTLKKLEEGKNIDKQFSKEKTILKDKWTFGILAVAPGMEMVKSWTKSEKLPQLKFFW